MLDCAADTAPPCSAILLVNVTEVFSCNNLTELVLEAIAPLKRKWPHFLWNSIAEFSRKSM